MKPGVSGTLGKSMSDGNGESWLAKDLVIGWQVDRTLSPLYWDDPSSSPGNHPADMVVSVSRESLAHHTVIVAQSGSGKSYFLGRIIEEILLKTRSRVLVLDPNADFRKVSQIKGSSWWNSPEKYRFSRRVGGGFLADEPTKEAFKNRWKSISKALYSQRRETISGWKRLQLNWINLPIELLLDEAYEEYRDQLRHCHSLVRILAKLAVDTGNEQWLADGAFFEKVNDLIRSSDPEREDRFASSLYREFQIPAPFERGPNVHQPESATDPNTPTNAGFRSPPLLEGLFAAGQRQQAEYGPPIRRAATHRKHISDRSRQFYFGRAEEVQQAELIIPLRQSFLPHSDERLRIVDVSSVRSDRHRKMVMSSFVEAEWDRARMEWEAAVDADPSMDKRVPTFIVVDEAHNAIPSSGETLAERKLQEQFRRVAAEGRKYGLFLILVSQRPDKLDRMVTSECENQAVMKLGSRLVLDTACQVLGLDGAATKAERVLDFDQGRALLVGPWAGTGPLTLMSAARRTAEGGRNLRASFWTQPEVFTPPGQHNGSGLASAGPSGTDAASGAG